MKSWKGVQFLQAILLVRMIFILATAAGAESPPASSWESPARLHRGLRSVSGTLIIDSVGIEFRSERQFSRRWPFQEIQSFDLLGRRLALTDYENRGWRRPGDRKFRFELGADMPPGIAARLASRVGKPAINGRPDPRAASFAAITARHRKGFGGSNGTLRFREDGIDYVSESGEDSRAWRWADIETLANPDSYHLRVEGYRETFEFELKQPISRPLLDRLWDRVYGRELRGLALGAAPEPRP